MEIIVSIENLVEERYGRIICYPRYNPEILEKRIREIKGIGVKAIIFAGDKMIDGIPVLGKGSTGVVLIALSNDNNRVALKILRTDAEPGRLIHEAEMLKMANSVNVGPKLLKYSESFLLTEHIGGEFLPKWVNSLDHGDEGSLKRLKQVLRDILEQCWRLDSIGLDHGELSWADKHIIINARDRPYIVDFESASNKRSVSNVTSISQYLFIRGKTASIITQKFIHVDASNIIQALRAYKAKHTREQFEHILRITGLI